MQPLLPVRLLFLHHLHLPLLLDSAFYIHDQGSVLSFISQLFDSSVGVGLIAGVQEPDVSALTSHLYPKTKKGKKECAISDLVQRITHRLHLCH